MILSTRRVASTAAILTGYEPVEMEQTTTTITAATDESGVCSVNGDVESRGYTSTTATLSRFFILKGVLRTSTVLTERSTKDYVDSARRTFRCLEEHTTVGGGFVREPTGCSTSMVRARERHGKDG